MPITLSLLPPSGAGAGLEECWPGGWCWTRPCKVAKEGALLTLRITEGFRHHTVHRRMETGLRMQATTSDHISPDIAYEEQNTAELIAIATSSQDTLEPSVGRLTNGDILCHVDKSHRLVSKNRLLFIL